MSLDMGLLMAGAMERGELEARVTSLINEIQKAGNVILFIDEVHTLIGSGTVGRGSKGSGLDIANLLKPSLGRGQLLCIAATTVDEHRTHFEKDKVLARCFQPVLINAPSQADAVRILLGLSEKYEAHHKCKYTLEGLNAAVYLSSRYIPDRHLPDKAIDLIDEAGSRARMDAFKRRKELQTCILLKPPNDYWQEIRAVHAMHEVVLANKVKYGDGAPHIVDDTKLISEPPMPSELDDDEPMVVGPDEIAAVA